MEKVCIDCDWKDNCSRVKCNVYAKKYKKVTTTRVINDIMSSLSCRLNHYPKKIFMSSKLYEVFTKQYFFDLHDNNKIYGVPVSVFNSDDYEWWFSWEQHKYTNKDNELERMNNL